MNGVQLFAQLVLLIAGGAIAGIATFAGSLHDFCDQMKWSHWAWVGVGALLTAPAVLCLLCAAIQGVLA